MDPMKKKQMTEDEQFAAAFDEGEDMSDPDGAMAEAGEMATGEGDVTDGATVTAGTDGEPAMTSEEGGTEATPDAALEEQRRKSWEGRQRKMAEEKAAMGASEAPAAVAVLDLDDEGGTTPADEPMQTVEDGSPEDNPMKSVGDVVSRVRERAKALMQGGDFESVLIDAADTYGEDFLAMSAALGSMLHKDLSAEAIDPLNKRIDGMTDALKSKFASDHMDTIMSVHEDAEGLTETPEFQKWLNSMEPERKAKAEYVIERGSAPRVVRLLNDFKASLKEMEEDVDPDDEAFGIRSTGAVRLPDPKSQSSRDDYDRAWEEAP